MSSIKDFDLLFYNGPYVVFDTESTSLHPNDIYGKLTEIGAVKVADGHISDTFSMLIDPECAIPKKIVGITGITDEMVKGQPTYPNVLKQFKEFCGDECILVMHNAPHDLEFLDFFGERCGVKFDYPAMDTLTLSRKIYPKEKVMDFQRSAKASYKLEDLCKMLGINDPSHHRAWNDAKVTAQLMFELKKEVIKLFPDKAGVSFGYNHFQSRPESNVAYKPTTSATSRKNPAVNKTALIQSMRLRSAQIWSKAVEKGEIFRIYFNLDLVVENRECTASVYFDILSQTWGVKNTPVALPNGLFDQLKTIYTRKYNLNDLSLEEVRKVSMYA